MSEHILTTIQEWRSAHDGLWRSQTPEEFDVALHRFVAATEALVQPFDRKDPDARTVAYYKDELLHARDLLIGRHFSTLEEAYSELAHGTNRERRLAYAALDRLGRDRKESEEPRPEDPDECSICWEDEYWHLRYQGQKGSYKDSRPLRLLAKLLRRPHYTFSVAALSGDPEDRIKKDSMLVGQDMMDAESVDELDQKIRRCKEELEDYKETDQRGETAAYENKQRELLQLIAHRKQVSHKGRKKGRKTKKFISPLERAFSNMRNQLQSLYRSDENENPGRLNKKMPNLAHHLRASIDMAFSDEGSFRYIPPSGHPEWKVKE